jgi:fatty acid synthase
MLGTNFDNHINDNNKIGEEIVEHYLNDIKEEHVMLKIFDKILKSLCDKNANTQKSFGDNMINQLKIDFQEQREFDMSRDIINQVSKNERFIRPILDIVNENNTTLRSIYVLEINLSGDVIAIEAEKYLSYYFLNPIDVNYIIVNNSIENLPDLNKNKSFKLIEWDFKQTSFPPVISSMDLIIFRDSQNLSELKIDKFLQEVYKKIKPNGFLLLIFRNKYTEPELLLNYILFEKNYTFNNYNLLKRIKEFTNSAQKLGLNIICRKNDSIGSVAILLRKVEPIDRIKINNNVIVEIDHNYDEWLGVLKAKIEETNKNDEISAQNSYIWLIANDSSINGIIGLTNTLRQEPEGERIRCIFDYDRQMKSSINFNEKPFSDILINDLAINVIRDGKLGTYRHLSLPKFYDKVEGNNYYLNIGQYGDLSSLRWFDSKNISKIDTYLSEDNHKIPLIHCDIYCSGLNFHDVLVATGIYYYIKDIALI